MCGGICGPVGNSDYRGPDIHCNICGKILRMCSCLSKSKKSIKKKKKISVVEFLPEG